MLHPAPLALSPERYTWKKIRKRKNVTGAILCYASPSLTLVRDSTEHTRLADYEVNRGHNLIVIRTGNTYDSWCDLFFVLEFVYVHECDIFSVQWRENVILSNVRSDKSDQKSYFFLHDYKRVMWAGLHFEIFQLSEVSLKNYLFPPHSAKFTCTFRVSLVPHRINIRITNVSVDDVGL